MANYLLVFHGGSMPESQEEGAKVMQAWTDWFGKLGRAVVDQGNPVSQVRTIAPDGTVKAGGTNPSSGYTILKADDLDQAVEFAKGCPVLQGGASVEVAETFAVT
jgi:hypothetical protein